MCRSAGESKTISDRGTVARNEEASASCFADTVDCMAIAWATCLQRTYFPDRNQPTVLYVNRLAISRALTQLLAA